MSFSQPLSSLAPDYSNQKIISSQIILQTVNDNPVIEYPKTSDFIIECPKKPECIIECRKKPECTIECPLKIPECPVKSDCEIECPVAKVECPCPKPECDPCISTGYRWGWFGALVLWFIVFTILFWLIFYSLKPSFVLQTDSNQVDTSKVLLFSVLSALILVIIMWLIKLAINRYNY